ncbi:MAG: UDP-N-acetylglucosamine 2-epimerase (non-hydrolyzing) [Candidatus Adiutrix sp.]|jgi:UDP-N-acetylglucosamine 2-epimerase (non-hydrolysing)|nr:UDP-N-acetylglucosamine 2-epimerase (non-hydrolyzing) [Candidatus Adiutrix sp.]
MKHPESVSRKKKILVVLGTRPEAIKLAPVILELRKNAEYDVFVCNTEQQKELSNQTLDFLGIRANFNLNAMLANQTLATVQSRILASLSVVYAVNDFDATVVQGDTMSMFCGALVSFYGGIPVFHVEAGLRSHDLFEPFPEEAMRQMTSRMAALHFAPTQLAVESLMRENIDPEKIALTGNTVIDALSCLSPKTVEAARGALMDKGVDPSDKLVLLTVHRRENHGGRLESILSAITDLAAAFHDHQFILPVHPNPNVKTRIHDVLGTRRNVVLTAPLNYPELVWIMKEAKLVLTDSGGIQEEAPTFGVPVLVMRYETERTEGVAAGYAKLVGADCRKIVAEAAAVLSKPKSATRLDGNKNPYGDGHAAKKIAMRIEGFWK